MIFITEEHFTSLFLSRKHLCLFGLFYVHCPKNLAFSHSLCLRFHLLCFLCFGTFTNVASTIVPSLKAIFFFLIWFRNKLKSLSSTLCFIKVSLKFHSVFLSGILFDTPRKFLKDSLSYI